MNARLRELEERQRLLVQRSGALRRHVAAQGGEIATSLSGVERGVAIARQLASLPAITTGVGVLLLAAGPSRALRWASRLLLAVTLARRVGAVWSRLPRGPA